MKKLLLLAGACLLTMSVNAQNTFPSNGNVGIGTNTPSDRLVISGSHSTSRMLINYLDNIAENQAHLTLWASEPNWTYTGVGIGNNVINGSNGIERINSSGRGGSFIRFLDAEVSMNVVQTNGTKVSFLHANSAGNVGIGTTTPAGKLDIKTNADHMVGLTISPSGNNHSYLSLDRKTGYDGGLLFSKDAAYSWQHRNNDDHSLMWYSYNKTGGGAIVLTLTKEGNMGIGTQTPAEKLSVNGVIRSKEVKVETANWPDYVFEEGYKVEKLEELERYVRTNKHLPGIPSAKEVEKEGLALGDMNAKLLQKIEELTLYVIELSKENNEQGTRIKELESRINKKKK